MSHQKQLTDRVIQIFEKLIDVDHYNPRSEEEAEAITRYLVYSINIKQLKEYKGTYIVGLKLSRSADKLFYNNNLLSKP